MSNLPNWVLHLLFFIGWGVTVLALTSYLWGIPLRCLQRRTKELTPATSENHPEPFQFSDGHVIHDFFGVKAVVMKLLNPDCYRYTLDIMGHLVTMITGGNKPTRELQEGDKLGAETLNFIIENHYRCPFCLEGSLHEGAHGGMAVNYDCDHCGSKLNFMGPFGIDVMIIGSHKYKEVSPWV